MTKGVFEEKGIEEIGEIRKTSKEREAHENGQVGNGTAAGFLLSPSPPASRFRR
uniref:Uncharacterized protein n=1 Tax=Oryza sativa subsp. japonica TaxID=39947 RepID=Q7XIK3_ORYSJ|nr:hypothetical protein [Oryza sativa Japonica Group]BAD30111.1 hypothetical protein [Oryza sativa Japonica Group]